MITLIAALLSLGIGVFMLKRNYPKYSESEPWISSKSFSVPLLITIALVTASLFQPFRIERIDTGHVGISVNLTGNSRGVSNYEYKTGWVVYNEWVKQVHEFPTYQQHIDYDPQIVITKGGFSATIKPSFNYSLKPGDVGDMYQNLKLGIKQIEQQWLNTAIVGTVNDVANKWDVDSIFNHREEFESAIVKEANERTKRWFVISQLRTNIVPPEALTNSIIAKTEAIQNVQVAENQRRVAIADAERKMAVARGDSAQAVIEAAGRSEAIKREQLYLTSLYIDYVKVTKWNGANSQVVSSSGSNLLLNVK